MRRLIKKHIIKDLNKKIVILTGPRQSGKTTISKTLFKTFDYYNHDLSEHRVALLDKSWDRKKELIIFDELNKKKDWKSWIKGIYDTEGVRPRIFITGSAKLDIYKKMGDSLAGRFFQYRLHPFDLKEVKKTINPDKAFNLLIKVGGFPEPFLNEDETFYNRWKKNHLDIILRQDLLDLETVKNIHSIETLVELLRHKVSSTISYSSLARDLEVSPKTVKRWIQILENLYIIYKITPYHKNIARSLLKEPKFYFYDSGQIKGDNGAKLENIIANAILKEIHFLEDTKGYTMNLHYLRNKDGREIDFLITKDNIPFLMIESKWADDSVSKSFKHFDKFFSEIKKIQLVKDLSREKTYPLGIEVRNAVSWLSEIDLTRTFHE